MCRKRKNFELKVQVKILSKSTGQNFELKSIEKVKLS